jgi:asparagine synthase (glutamine-hydrolysing)
MVGVHEITPESVGEVQPATDGLGNVAVFDGRIDDRSRLASILGSDAPDPASPDVEFVLASFRRFGDGFADHLLGDFATAVFDPRARRWLLARDSIGLKPLYFTELHGGGLVFASEIKALLAYPGVLAAPNLDVLARFVLGAAPERDPWSSMFAGIRAVPPGVVLSADSRGLRHRTYWDFDPGRTLRLPAYGDYVDGFREHFGRAVARRLRAHHPVAVAVSGGLDSSAIFCQALSMGSSSVRGFTFEGPAGTETDEIAYVEEIERAYGVAIERIPFRLEDPIPSAPRQVADFELPVLDEQESVVMALYSVAVSAGCRVLVSGTWGDQLVTDTTYLMDLVDRLAWRETMRHIRAQGISVPWLGEKYFRRRFLSDLPRWHVPRALIPTLRGLRARRQGLHRDRAWYTEEFRARAMRPATGTPIGGFSRTRASSRYYYGYVRSRSHTLFMETADKNMAAHGLMAAFPYLDRDLLEFVMAVPGEMICFGGRSRSIQRDAMLGVLPEAIRQRRSKADFTEPSNAALLKGLRTLGASSLGQAAARWNLVDPARLQDELAQVSQALRGSENFRAGDSLGQLVALEYWLERFFSDRAGESL